MRHLMDEVDYDNGGSCVRMIKRLPVARRKDASG